MQFKFLTAAALMWGLPGLCWAQTQAEIRQFTQDELETLGRQMFDQDEEAARATDILFSQKDQKALEEEKIRGWIVDPSLISAKVRFVRDGQNGLEAAYDIEFVQDRPPRISVPADRSLSNDEKAQLAARNLALKNIERPCSDRYNTIVLRDPQADDWLVWAIAATLDPKLVIVGGHYRFTVSKDGGTLLGSDALSRGCLTMRDPETKDEKTASLESTQLVSNIPVETFVLLSFQRRLPIFVLTPDRNLWAVEGAKMRIVQKLDDPAVAKPQ